MTNEAGPAKYCSTCMRFAPCEHITLQPPMLPLPDNERCLACGCRGIHKVDCPRRLSPQELAEVYAEALPAKTKSDGWSTNYYELPPDAREVQDLIEYRNMNFAIANIFKACYRLGQKEGIDPLYDIRKIIWFANRELARLTKNTTTGETK